MKSQALCCVLAAFFGLALTAQVKEPTTAQTKRGRALFQQSPKGTPCATCHSMAGIGTAVGPDLTTLAKLATPRGLVAAMQMTMTVNVQQVKTASGTFPGIQQEKQGDEIAVWDLSATPPVLRKLTSKAILSMTRDQQWKHPPAATEYTSQEFADIVGFLRWAATGSQREITVAEIEGSNQ